MKKLKAILGFALLFAMFLTINISTDASAHPEECEEGYHTNTWSKGVCWGGQASNCRPSSTHTQCNAGFQ